MRSAAKNCLEDGGRDECCARGTARSPKKLTVSTRQDLPGFHERVVWVVCFVVAGDHPPGPGSGLGRSRSRARPVSKLLWQVSTYVEPGGQRSKDGIIMGDLRFCPHPSTVA